MATWRQWGAYSLILAVGLAVGCKKKPAAPPPAPSSNSPGAGSSGAGNGGTGGSGSLASSPGASSPGATGDAGETEVVDQDRLASKYSYRIALVGRGKSDEVSRAIMGSMKLALADFADLHSLTLDVQDATPADRSTTAQAAAIESVTGKNFDGVVVETDDDHAQSTTVEGTAMPVVPAGVDAARRGGADVVLTGVDFIAADRIAYVGQDEHAVGVAAGEALAELMGGPGACVIMAGPAVRPELASRANGAASLLRERGFTVHIVNHAAANVGTETGNARQAHPDASGWIFVAAWDEGAMPVEANVVAIEPTTARLSALPTGEVDAVVASDYHAWGRASIDTLLNKLHLGSLPDQTESYVEPVVLTRGVNGGDDGTAYLAQWREWLDRAK